MATTLGQFLTVISANLGLNNSGTLGSSPTADQNLMVTWTNEGITDVIVRTRCNVIPATLTLTAGAYDYALPTQILAMDECFSTDQSTNVWYRLNRVSPQQLLNYRVGTQFAGSPPVRWYALNGANLLMVYPTPTAADILTYYYVPRPAVLVNSSDSNTDIPAEWQKAVEYYGCWQAGKYINDGPSQNGNTFMQLYEQELVRLKKGMKQKGGLSLSNAVVGRRLGNRNWPIGTNSQQYV